jgi:predicted Zn-dependent peptidase
MIAFSRIQLDRLGALAGILLLQAGCWWEARPGSIPAVEAASIPGFNLSSVDTQDVGLRLFLRAGSAHDPVGLEGLACGLAQAQLSQAMDSDPQRQSRLQDAGLEWSLEVDRELISIEMHAQESAVGDLTSLLGDAIVTGEIADPHRHMVTESTRSLAQARFLDWLYAGHPYGHDPGCSQPLDGRLGTLQMMNFHQDRYLRSTARLVVELPGDLNQISSEASDAINGLVSRLGTLPPHIYEDVSPRMIPRPMEGRLVLAESAPAELWMGWATPVHPAHPDWAAMLLASEILTIRLQPLQPAGVLHPVGWLDEEGQTPAWLGLPLIVGWTEVDTQGELVEAVLPKLQDWSQGPFTQAEINRARAQLAARHEVGLKLRGAQDELMGWTEAWGELPTALAAVTPQDLVDSIGRHAPPDELRIFAGVAAGADPDWNFLEGNGEVSVDAAVPKYDWNMGVPVRIQLQEP